MARHLEAVEVNRGDPLFYATFETSPQDRSVAVVEAEETPELKDYMDLISRRRELRQPDVFAVRSRRGAATYDAGQAHATAGGRRHVNAGTTAVGVLAELRHRAATLHRAGKLAEARPIYAAYLAAAAP